MERWRVSPTAAVEGQQTPFDSAQGRLSPADAGSE